MNKDGAYEEILGENGGKFASKRAAKCAARFLCGVALISSSLKIIDTDSSFLSNVSLYTPCFNSEIFTFISL